MLDNLQLLQFFWPFLVVLAVEMTASPMWVPMHFRFGVPLLRLPFALPPPLTKLPAASSLEYSFQYDWAWGLAFKELSSVEIAFREAAFQLPGLVRGQYMPALHGLI